MERKQNRTENQFTIFWTYTNCYCCLIIKLWKMYNGFSFFENKETNFRVLWWNFFVGITSIVNIVVNEKSFCKKWLYCRFGLVSTVSQIFWIRFLVFDICGEILLISELKIPQRYIWYIQSYDFLFSYFFSPIFLWVVKYVHPKIIPINWTKKNSWRKR